MALPVTSKYFFSFSGLKTAVWQLVSKNNNMSEDFKANLCASFQEEVVGALVEKMEMALEEYPSRALVVAGGVACNSRLREKMKALAEAKKIPCYISSPLNCTDNAAMIAYVGARQIKEGKVAAEASSARLALTQDFTNPARLGLFVGAAGAPFMGILGAYLGLMSNGWALAAIGSTESIVAGLTVILAGRINDWRFRRKLRRLLPS